DLDLVFVSWELGRSEALAEIEAKLANVRQRLTATGLQVELGRGAQGDETKLFVSRGSTRVKVEVNHVFRGTLLPVGDRPLDAMVKQSFTADIVLPVLDSRELYGSKLVAALDRQHPRDWFDVSKLLARGKLTTGIVDCLVGYLAGHNRPVHEVLFSRDQEMADVFGREFLGMAREPVDLADLVDTRRELRDQLVTALHEYHRNFLVSLVRAQPEWTLMPFAHLSRLPAVRWKLQNLLQLKARNSRKFELQAVALEKLFERS
ncbi:nucleotidyl transferase AbiEii/AbiGii toxin family protein, partial [Opitutaceae bacterium]|nr:nucleotidyl transferase AbiEii/AbiGii toxin family protein [Opitutaceae bacterium]